MVKKRLTYKVQRGDDYTKIADKLYGDKRYRTALKRQNPKVKKPRPGMVIDLLDDDPKEMWKKRERGRRKQAALRGRDWESVKRRYGINPNPKDIEPITYTIQPQQPPPPEEPTPWWEDPTFQEGLIGLVEATAQNMGLDSNVMLDELGLGEGSPLLAEAPSTGQAQPQTGSPSSTPPMTDKEKKALKKELGKMGLDADVAMYELGLSDRDPYAWETPQVPTQSSGATGGKTQGDTKDSPGSITAPQKPNFDRNNEIDSCYASSSGEELAQCLNNIMQSNYEEAGLNLDELAANPPKENPLGEIEGLDLSWWEPMFFWNQQENWNALFLKELGLNWEYPPNYEQNFLDALKEEYHDFWEEIQSGDFIPTPLQNKIAEEPQEPQKNLFDRNAYIDTCYEDMNVEEISQCMINIMKLNYEEAGFDLDELAANPPSKNPLGTVEGLDLSPWKPMFIMNKQEDGNVEFLKELDMNFEYYPNYEENLLEALKAEHNKLWEEVKEKNEYSIESGGKVEDLTEIILHDLPIELIPEMVEWLKKLYSVYPPVE